MKILITIAFIIICSVNVTADILNVPQPYSTIQTAVYLAQHGDTVLVAEGTYLENVLIENKSIILASHYLIDKDTSHISKTIIDGSQPVNTDDAPTVVIMFSPDTTTVLCGFTITGGFGKKLPDKYGNPSRVTGGVGVIGSSAIVEHNIITGNIINKSTVPDTYYWAGAAGLGVEPLEVDGVTVIIRNNRIFNNEVVGEHTSSGGLGLGCLNQGQVFNFIVEQNIIENNIVINTDDWKAMGGGMTISLVLPTTGTQIVRNNVIRGNEVKGEHSFGGGLYIVFDERSEEGAVDNDPGPYICNNIITNNHSDYMGGGVSVWRAYFPSGGEPEPLDSIGNYVPKPSIINNTIVNNTAQDGSGIFIMNHVPFLMNNILWNVHPDDAEWGEIFLGNVSRWIEDNNYGGIEIHYSDVQGGWEGEGNIDSDPLLADSINCYLSEESPCIDAGHENSIFNDIENGGIAIWPAMGSERNDMGVYGGPFEYNPEELTEIIDYLTDIPDLDRKKPINFQLFQNYPNPFNPSTKIKFYLQKAENVKIEIYNTLGQIIETLLNQHMKTGYHEVDFNAQNLSSGIYFYQIQAGNFQDVKKMFLIR
jgi:hypothetical protein